MFFIGAQKNIGKTFDMLKNIQFQKIFLKSYIYLFISGEKDKEIYIDMKNIISYPTRMFTRLEKYLDRIVLFNVMSESTIKDRISEDLMQLKWASDSVAYYSNKSAMEIEEIVNNQCSIARKSKINQIVQDLVQCDENMMIHLESSGLYSNCYIDVKKLFLDVDNYYYIIYSLAEIVFNRIGHVDAFVSSSKNGAIIANILGGLLDVKEVHLIGVGPKYAMELGDTIDCIKQGKKYAYIFDFMCTGTELKIVSALINSKKAFLTYAAGIAKHKNDVSTYMMQEIDVLTDTKALGIDYKIVAEKNSI